MAPSLPQQLNLALADLKALSVLGQGARGVVFHVVPVAAGGDSTAAGAGEPMALKAMSRAAARHKGAAGPAGGTCGGDGHRRIWFERDVLLALRHPLLPSLRGVVATDAVVGFVINRCPGGDLKSLRRRWRAQTTFPESVIRFYAAELVLALEHLHGLGVVYRDLKPENVLIQESGHVMLVDFDLSTTLPPPLPPPPPDAAPARASSLLPSSHRHRRRNKNKKASTVFACFSRRHVASPETSPQSPLFTSMTAPSASSSSCCSPPGLRTPAKSNSFVGTEDYVAPEIVAGSGHDYAVDWWGLGVVIYEMLYGCTPFRGRSRRETFHRVLTAPPELPGEATPLCDLITRLLEKDPGKRLGARGVKRHAFFRGVDWDRVLDVARPPFIPSPDENDANSGAVVEAEALDVEKVVHEVFGSSGAGETSLMDVCSDGGTDDDFSIFF
jgi:serine/threonine-protein kinase OXI1